MLNFHLFVLFQNNGRPIKTTVDYTVAQFTMNSAMLYEQ